MEKEKTMLVVSDKQNLMEEIIDKKIEEIKEQEPEQLIESMIVQEEKIKGRDEIEKEKREEMLHAWVPKTQLGKEVKSGKIKNIDEILDSGKKILESEIIDMLIPLKSDLISVGQSKGKFGGGKRRAWRQTQRKTKEGNVPTFSAFAVVGDEKSHVGLGVGRASETLPARDKAIRKAKLNIIKITRGDGSFDSIGGGNSSIPFKVEGKAGSVRVVLLPAPPGTGLVAADQLKKVLRLVGIKDIYTKTEGTLRTSFNLVKACIDALQKTNMRGGSK